MLLFAHQATAVVVAAAAAATTPLPLPNPRAPSFPQGRGAQILRRFSGTVFPTFFAIVLWWGSAGLIMRWILTLARPITLMLSARAREEYLP